MPNNMQSGKPKRVIIKIQSGLEASGRMILSPKKEESKGKAPEKYSAQNDINLHISEARKRKLERGFWGSGRKQEVAQQPGDKEVGGRQPATR